MAYQTMDVQVDGGTLRVGCWGDPAGMPVALAVHGITASHLAWSRLADELDGLALVAPDLRGRGRSARLPGPYGMAAHADDMARVLDAVGCRAAVVVGHSMGAYVATVLAQRHRARVSALVLVDGGLPFPAVDGDPDKLLNQALGAAAERLSRTFASVTEYREFWRVHPAIGQLWGPAVEAYVDYDLVGTPPKLVSCVSYEAVRDDQRDLLFGADARGALGQVAVPTTFLRAERNLQNAEPGLFPAEYVAAAIADLPIVTWRDVPDTNHYAIVMGNGAPQVAETVRGAIIGAGYAPDPTRQAQRGSR